MSACFTFARPRPGNPPLSTSWTPEEDVLLRQLVTSKADSPSWADIHRLFPSKTVHQVCDRWEKVLNPALGRPAWTRDEDTTISKWIDDHGPKDWSGLADQLPGRGSKQCRERWCNHLSPACRKGGWTAEEDSIVIEYQQKWGNKWTKIAAMLPGRTDNAVKNRWNSSLHERCEPMKAVAASDEAAKLMEDITSPWFSPGPSSLAFEELEPIWAPNPDDYRRFAMDKDMLETVNLPSLDDCEGYWRFQTLE